MLRACILCWALVCAGLGGCRKEPVWVPDSGIDPNESEWVRVLLFGNLTECTITAPGRLQVTCPQRSASVEYPQEVSELKVSIRDGRLIVGEQVFENPVEITTSNPEQFGIEDLHFRGRLHLAANPDGQSFTAINRILLEEYLFGVIGAEMQSYWEPEALKAQAVASRTYCLFIKHRFGDGRDYDVRRSQAHQVYRGIAAETGPTRQAVLDTKGQVLLCSVPGDANRIFPSYYSSCCGGHTDDSSLIFGDDYPTLKGTECPYCRKSTRSEFYYWPPVSFTKQELTDRLLGRYDNLAGLERIDKVEAVRVSDSGRVTSVRLTGSSGKDAYLRGEDFRLATDPSGRRLKSAIFRIHNSDKGFEFTDGRGFGHGVGMCQSGAQTLARKGKTCREILSHYYPTSRLVRIDFSGTE